MAVWAVKEGAWERTPRRRNDPPTIFAKAAAATTAGAFMSLAGPIIEKAYGQGLAPDI